MTFYKFFLFVKLLGKLQLDKNRKIPLLNWNSGSKFCKYNELKMTALGGSTSFI